MLKSFKTKEGQKGFTLIELLVVAAIIGILLAIAIPNLIKARMSANEANARKAMQTLRDAEGEFFEQDLNNSGSRDFTEQIGDGALENTLRCPADPPGGSCGPVDELVDGSFTFADITDGIGQNQNGTGDASSCMDPKAGYCLVSNFAGFNQISTNAGGSGINFDDFGWEASMTSSNKTGRRDYSIFGDGVIRCTVTQQVVAAPGQFESVRTNIACD